MKKQIMIIAGSLIGSGIVAASATGVVSAASNTGNVGMSGIPKSIFQQDRLDSVAEVLNTSTANIQTARKDHTMKQLINQAGLTKKTFMTKVKAQLTSELESHGYSQDQITIALQHRTIARLRHHK